MREGQHSQLTWEFLPYTTLTIDQLRLPGLSTKCIAERPGSMRQITSKSATWRTCQVNTCFWEVQPPIKLILSIKKHTWHVNFHFWEQQDKPASLNRSIVPFVSFRWKCQRPADLDQSDITFGTLLHHSSDMWHYWVNFNYESLSLFLQYLKQKCNLGYSITAS